MKKRKFRNRKKEILSATEKTGLSINDWQPGVYCDALVWVSRKINQVNLQTAARV